MLSCLANRWLTGHGQRDNEVISSYHNFFMPAVFRHDMGQALRNVCYCESLSYFLLSYDSDNTDMFLNELIQFYSNNATNLHHFTSHSTRTVRHVAHNSDRTVTTGYCDVTSPYVYDVYGGGPKCSRTSSLGEFCSIEQLLGRSPVLRT